MPAIRDTVHSLNQAVRGLLRRPAFAALAIATLGLGIGSSVAMFSIANGVLLRPLPYPNAASLRFISSRDGSAGAHQPLSYADFADLRKWIPGRRIRFSAGWGTLLTNDFRGCDPDSGTGFDPLSLICKVHEVEGRPAVKLSDNYAKAMGPPSEIGRYRRVFGTVGVANVPVLV